MNVSLIIPVLNEGEQLVSMLKRAWATGAFEVIVVDGGSVDDSLAIAQNTRCQVIESPRGRAIQLNRGAAAARGDVLLFLHADNWLEDGAVRQIVDAIDSGDCQTGAFRQKIDGRGLLYRLLEWGNGIRVRMLGVAYGDQGIFVRRELFEKVGGYPEIPLMEDLRLMRTLRRHSRPVLLPGPLHVSPRRWQRHGVIRQTLRNWLLLTAEKVGVSPARLARFYPSHTKSSIAHDETTATSTTP